MKRWSLMALICTVGAFAYLMQGPGASQSSHYAQIKALTNGTATVDETRHQIGDVATPDLSYWHGHYYSNKAPGLAFLTLPVYVGLKAAGADTSGDPRRILWALGLLGTVLPMGIALFVVRWLGDWFAPGYGTAAATTFGLGTIALPFGTMFFSHALSSMLAVAAFALLVRERGGAQRLSLVFVAGSVAGLAVTAEYPAALAAAILAGYTLTRADRLRRLATYGAGGLIGVLPLLAYNTWAFGSPAHMSYVKAINFPGRSGHDQLVEDRAFGMRAPDIHEAASMLFTRWGLLGTGPVIAVGVAGAVIAYRRGRRAEAIVVLAVAAATVAYVSGYFGSWGSISPGPRYMILLLPFVGAPAALAFRRAPAVAVTLASVSIIGLTCVTATLPMKAWFGGVVDRLTSGAADGYSPSVTELVGISGWYDIVPFFALVAAAVASTIVATPRATTTANDVAAAVAAMGAWAFVVWLAAPRLLESSLAPFVSGVLVFAIVAAGAALVVALEAARFRRGGVDRRTAASSSAHRLEPR